jgi:hypothetical protein
MFSYAIPLLVCLSSGLPQRPEAAKPPLSLDAEATLGRWADRAAAFLDRSWRRRPEWADMLISALRGESPGAGRGWWKPSATLRGWDWLRGRFDADGNGKVTPWELGPAAAYFDRLDRGDDGALTRDDLEGQGAQLGNQLTEALYRSLDEDRNDRVSWDELAWFFQRADRNKRGFISRQDLAALVAAASPGVFATADDRPSRWAVARRFFSGELGSFREGPALGALAPDFDLPAVGGRKRVRLSDARMKRPVALIFGSFT